jgi:hypothetical protein
VNLQHGPYFATIGLHSEAEFVLVNFGDQPFEFDIVSYLKSQRLTPVSLPLMSPHELDRNPINDSENEDIDLVNLIRKYKNSFFFFFLLSLCSAKENLMQICLLRVF